LEELGIRENINLYTDCIAVKSENVIIKKIKAHKKKSDCDEIDLLFREIDILSRKELRKRRETFLNVF
jgi:hypothetical protein